MVWNIFYLPIQLGISSPQLTFICFGGVGIPPTRNCWPYFFLNLTLTCGLDPPTPLANVDQLDTMETRLLNQRMNLIMTSRRNSVTGMMRNHRTGPTLKTTSFQLSELLHSQISFITIPIGSMYGIYLYMYIC